jgi:hypothetical protein
MNTALANHLIQLENNGRLKTSGPADEVTSADALREIVLQRIPETLGAGNKLRIALYAHGGVNWAAGAMQHADAWRERYLAQGIYPLFFIWRSDPLSAIKDTWEDIWNKERPRAIFTEDQVDDYLEPMARFIGVKTLWDQMKDNALGATRNDFGGARQLAALLKTLSATREIGVNLVGHSAGGIFHAPLAVHLRDLGVPLDSISLWAPGTTLALFRETYLPLIRAQTVRRFGLYNLSDADERADSCNNIYKKSILYLVSRALEDPFNFINRAGVPLLGLQHSVDADPALRDLWRGNAVESIVARSGDGRSAAQFHGSFDNDVKTVDDTIKRILNS